MWSCIGRSEAAGSELRRSVAVVLPGKHGLIHKRTVCYSPIVSSRGENDVA